MKVLIVYYSRTGKTKKMAEEIMKGAEEGIAEVRLKSVEEANNKDLLWADGIIIGSPTYFGILASEVKKFLDDSIEVRGKLENKIGAAFASSQHRAGGRETTILTILHALMIHGMIICGDPLISGGHYGPACDKFDSQAKKECHELGKRVARLIKKLNK